MPDNPLVYHDFVLELTNLQADGVFKVRVSGETPSGRTMRADEAGTSSYKPEDVKRLLDMNGQSREKVSERVLERETDDDAEDG